MNFIKSKRHKLNTIKVNKICISCFDNEKYLLNDGITSYAYGHYKMSAVWAQLFDGVISARGIFGRYTNIIGECYDMCNSTQNNVSSCLFPKFCQTRIRIHRTPRLQHENVCLNNLELRVLMECERGFK